MKTEDIMTVLKVLVEQHHADGCLNCAYIDKEDWEMPCSKCKRAANDYWRRKEQ